MNRTLAASGLGWPLLVAGLAWALGAWLKYGFLEVEALSAPCFGQSPPWWCEVRSALGLAIHFQILGWLGFILGAASWLVGGRRLALAGLAVSLLALLLYRPGPAAFGFVLALWRSLRP